MRIIKAAKKVDEFTVTCDNCGSVLGVRKNDLNNSTHMGDNECTEWTYYCGVCSCKNHLKGLLSDFFPWIMEDKNDRELQGDNTMWVNSL